MTLDRNYNIKTATTDAYSNAFDEVVDLVAQAKDEGKITDDEAALLINIAMKKNSFRELKNFFNSLGHFQKTQNNGNNQTLFIHLKTNRTTYA